MNTGEAHLRQKKMRGGLGRTLLTAFLLLTLVPLSVISVYAIQQIRAVEENHRLSQAALLAEGYRPYIAQALADGGVTTGAEATSATVTVALADLNLSPGGAGRHLYLFLGPELYPVEATTPPVPAEVQSVILTGGATSQNGLLPPTAAWGRAAFQRIAVGEGIELVVVVPEMTGTEAPDSLAATLIAATLVVALVATVGAAFLTRQITRPLYELTQSAVTIAQGELDRRAKVEQENELGLLALAFNMMTAQLQESLTSLEEKVERRTQQLQQANAEIAKRARQLETGAEIGRQWSGLHDLEHLLVRACDDIQAGFDYASVSLWLRERRGEATAITLVHITPPASRNEHLARAAFVQQSLSRNAVQVGAQGYSMAVPLRVAQNLGGVLMVRGQHPFEDHDQRHLQILADTLAVLIENARAADVEHAALEKLRLLEQWRTDSLGKMSQELSTSLNTIIGYSGLLLRENSGPLTDRQRSDISFINRNGTELLSLLDGILELLDEAEGRSVVPSGDKL